MSQNSSRSEKRRKRKKKEALLRAKRVLSDEIKGRLGESLVIVTKGSKYYHGIYNSDDSRADSFNLDKVKKIKGFVSGGRADTKFGTKRIVYTIVIEPSCFYHIKRDRNIKNIKKMRIVAFGDNNSITMSEPQITKTLLIEKSFKSIVDKELPESKRRKRNPILYGAPSPKDMKLSKKEKSERW